VTELLRAGGAVTTVFDLLGHHENDMTHALGWGLARSDAFLHLLLDAVAISPGDGAVVRLQQHDVAGGFTDIEVTDGASYHVIIEAKRGWWLPGDEQLRLYARRLVASATPQACLVVLTQWGAESSARHAIAQMDLPYRCVVLGWADIVGLVRRARRADRSTSRLWLTELDHYLMGVTDMRDIDSNSVYVVSLGGNGPDGWPINFIEVVTQLGRYFFPATGKSWPKQPPNYIAFRFDGRLQAIHHVDDYVIATDMSTVLPVPPTTWEPHFVLTLGPAIRPGQVVPTGDRIRRSARVWADIDLLLTAPTISDALLRTQERRTT
jgi:hypothetical protein